MFDKHKSNPRKTWQMIKSLLPNAKDSSPTINKIVLNKTEINDTASIANQFNTYFSSVGKNLAMKFSEQNDTDHHKFLGKRISNSIYLEPTSPQEVFKEINSLNLNKSPGLDGITAYFIKLASDIVAVPLSILCNLSFSEGVFPNCMKNAKVIPLFKTGSKTELSNYRPISLLSCLSKVMEKLIYSRLINYLNKNSILHPNQYGFRSGLSTSHALLDVVTTTYDNINKMLYTLLIFIDYKKAFDTVCHKILLSKLEHYGICGPALNLISSYLNHRTQCVSINDRLSALSHISYGVPQGSILGPLLFLLYINDINNINTYSNDSIKQYADDTCLVINEINLDKLKAKANKLLLSTEQWSSANKLTINFSKCKAMIIAPKLRSRSCTIPILINDIPIPIVDSFRYLGVILDNKLTFSDHISNVAKKVSRSVGIISKLRHYAPTSILLKLYYAILHPHLLYGTIIWGSTYKSYLQKLVSLQNKGLRLITNNFTFHQPFVSVSLLHKQNKILKLSDIYTYEVAIFMHKFCNKKLPITFSKYFCKTDTVHKLRTRQNLACKFAILRYSTSRLQRSIKLRFRSGGTKIWNSISSETRNSSFKVFKKKYKHCLLALY